MKQDGGKQGTQLRMGIWWALQRGYKGIITIDGNNKDSIEDVPQFIRKLQEGYDFVQGSKFVKGDSYAAYPGKGKIPTKISAWKGNGNLMKILLKNASGEYNPL